MQAERPESLEESGLDAALRQTQRTFDGNTLPDETDDEDEGDPVSFGGHPAQESESNEEDHGEQGEGGTPPTPTPVTPATPPEPESTQDPRRLEAENRMHLANAEAAELRANKERLEREIADLRRVSTPTPTTTPQEIPVIKAAREQLGQKLREVTAIDNTLADYWEKVANGWADAFEPLAAEVFNNLSKAQQAAVKRELLNDQEFMDSLRTNLMPQVQSVLKVEQENTRIFDHVTALAKEAGFDVATKSEDADLFWDVAVASVDKSMPTATMEEKATRAVDIMRTLKGVPVNSQTPAVQPVVVPESSRRIRQPMGRQSAGPVSPTGGSEIPEQPLSIDGALRIAEKRV